jgi:hypothetical protein
VETQPDHRKINKINKIYKNYKKKGKFLKIPFIRKRTLFGGFWGSRDPPFSGLLPFRASFCSPKKIWHFGLCIFVFLSKSALFFLVATWYLRVKNIKKRIKNARLKKQRSRVFFFPAKVGGDPFQKKKKQGETSGTPENTIFSIFYENSNRPFWDF